VRSLTKEDSENQGDDERGDAEHNLMLGLAESIEFAAFVVVR
jgi:hypothetical protein